MQCVKAGMTLASFAMIHYAAADTLAAASGKQIDNLLQPPPGAVVVSAATTSSNAFSFSPIIVNAITDVEHSVTRPADSLLISLK